MKTTENLNPISEKDARRKERGEQFGFHADNSIANWLNGYSKQVNCPTSGVIRASLILLASVTNPKLGRTLLDAQMSQCSLKEVWLLAAVRKISKADLKG